ncbi:GTP cyclohydrolase 1 [Auxenochlorella protothecoides]|uniref:GTP cyclohydrolase 1 n=1 Tax=Auxenochlorella protothecoides TaxID=3075 RepID=A0A087SNC3_AUXPR|nr:GTP cyclohydrolase 1 [Auxenochlorella protothecoides]KFM27227.1 GTP cyclohydrolase 1 [Auxenochlorella protothecoides]
MVTTSSAVQAQPPPAAASGEPAVLDRMKGAVTTLLECIGEDPKREGLVDTPKRVAKAWLDMTRGSGQDHTGAFGSALFHEPCLAAASDGLVLVRDITFAALSSSALLPFYGAVHVAYLPRHGTILGLSKLARVTKVLAARLQDQAGFTRSLLAAVVAELAPAGAAVVCVARQLGGIEAESGPRVTCLAAGALRRADRLIELEAVLDLAPGSLDLGAEGAAGLDTELLIGSGPDHVDAAVRVLVEGVAEAHGAKVDARALVASRRYVAWLLRATAGYGAALPRGAPGALMASLALPAPTRAAPHSALHLSCHAFSSECEHHLLPFHGTVGFAVLGAAPDAGALRAAVAAYSRRLQVQERLTLAGGERREPGGAGALC